ncbi:MAG: TonB-dependent receptor [Acidobacteria bacterium]|nr:TonB-dependent receptor [Acidobacteriota bacterium]
MTGVCARLAAIVAFFGCSITIALGQGTTVSILGTIYDQSRAVLPGVSVTATDKDTGQKRTAVTDDQGRYAMAQVRIGTYLLQAELPGFQTASREVSLTLEGDAVANFTLAVGAETTEITVTSEAALVETTASSVRGLVDHQQIRDLPLNGRSFTDLATIQAGVVIDYSGARTQIGNEGVKISVGGARRTATGFQLDGTELRNQMSATPGSLAGVLLGVDTIQEFSVITTVAGAEYGGFSGGVINAVTRSGTNSFHGTVFEFLRNSALDARNFFDRDVRNPLTRSAPPAFKRNQYGFTLGGPIRKDKLFFFTSVEGLNDRLTTTNTASVPSLDARRGFIPLRGQFTVSPITKPILDAYPLPNGAVRPDGTADYVFETRRVTDETYFVTKIDWQVSEKDALSVRYTLDDASRDAPFNMDVVFDVSKTRAQYALVEWKRIFSPRLINEAKVSLNRSFNGDNPEERKPLPPVMQFNPLSFNFTGQPRRGTISVPGISILGFSSVFGKQVTPNRFQYIDNLTYTTGAHSLKAGFNIQRIQLNHSTPIFMAGGYTFVNLQDLIVAATPRQFLGTITGVIPRGMRQLNMGFYAQDDWRVRPNLTLNLGLRYEPITLPYEVRGRLANFRNASDSKITVGNPLFTVNPSLKNFAPRVGFAWDPFGDGRTSIRGGYGIFYELFQPLQYHGGNPIAPPFSIRVALNRPPFPDFRSALPADPDQIIATPWGISDSVEQEGVHQYQLSIQRQISADTVIQLAYIGSRGYNLVHMMDRNTAIPQRDPEGLFPFYPAGSRRRNPNFTQMRDYGWDGSSYYNALGLTVKKRFAQGYSYQVAYTFGKNIDNTSAAGVGESDAQPNGLSTFPEDIDFDKGLSVFDTRHRIVINGSWDLPIGSGRAFGGGWKGLPQALLGAWTVNGILTVSDGGWSNVRLPFNWSRSQQVTDIPDRPSLIPGGNNNPVLSDGREPTRYFDGSQFVLGPQGYFGNVARNTISRPGVLTIDFSVLKNFNFSEERYLQFRAEMFNLANRANFSAPDTNTILNETGQRSLTTGRITSTTTTSRQVQFALKIYF